MNSLQRRVYEKLELIVYRNLTQDQLDSYNISYEVIYGTTACQLPCYTLKNATEFSIHENLFVDKDLFDQRVVDLCVTYWPFNLHVDTRKLPITIAEHQNHGLDNSLCTKILKKIEFLESDYDDDLSRRFL